MRCLEVSLAHRLKFGWMLTLAVFSAALLLGCLPAVYAQSIERLPVLDLKANTTAEASERAREAFQKGQIVRIVGTDPEQLKKTLGISLIQARPTEQQRSFRAGGKAASAKREPSVLRVSAVRRTARGEVHQYAGYTSAKDPAARTSWVRQFDRWAAKESEAAPQAGAPEPPAEAWTTLIKATTSVQSDYFNILQVVTSVYRLNELQAETDWYMVLTDTETIPNYTDFFDNTQPGVCNFFDQCDWHMFTRTVRIAMPSGTLVDHGPTGTINTERAGFSIGASLTPAGGGGTASYSQSWSQPSLTTLDQSTTTLGAWDETVQYEDSDRLPYRIEEVGFGTFISYQGAIFSVPGGAGSITVQMNAAANFLQYQDTVPIPPDSDTVNTNINIETGPPVLTAAPTLLSIPAGGSAYFGVTALIPNSLEGLSWKLKPNQLWLDIPSQGPFSKSNFVQVFVEPGTLVGSVGQISVDTDPPYGAPSVEGGPLIVRVVVTPGGPSGLPPSGVLLAGGDFGGTVLQTAVVYDLATRAVIPVGNMTSPREGHTATLLGSGDILLTGGAIAAGTTVNPPATASAEIYRSATGLFSPVGNMTTVRTGHTATLLANGKVLIVGGSDSNGNTLVSAETYDPTTQTFTATAGSLLSPRSAFGATAVDQDTKVLVYGGIDQSDTPLNTSELWDSASGTFSASNPMAAAQALFPQATVSSSQVAIVGGLGAGNAVATSEQLLNLDSQTFAAGSNLNTPRLNHTLSALANGGGLLVTGGGNRSTFALDTAELRDGSEWAALTEKMTTPRVFHTATLLPDDQVFIAGGRSSSGASSTLASTEFYDPVAKTFSVGPFIPPRSGHTATAFALKNVPTTTTVALGTPIASYGQQVAFTATVRPGTATGTVTFKDGTTTLGSISLQSDGQAIYRTTELTGGPHSITATYSGDTTFAASTSAAVTQTINPINTTTTLNANPNPAEQGTTVNLSATVLNSAGTLVGEGTVRFLNGGTLLGSKPVQNGAATLAVPGLAVGNYTLVASYSGDTNFNPSTASVSQTVNPVRTTTTVSLASNPNQPTYGQAVTFSATVRPSTGSGRPTGNIRFFDGTTFLATIPIGSGGLAPLTTLLAAGPHSITARYEGDNNFSGNNSAPVATTVRPATPGAILTSSLSPSQQGQPVSFVTTLSFPAGAPKQPTGSVRFFDGATGIGTALVEGSSATLPPYSALSVGTHQITATYLGDDNYAVSTSNVFVQVVQQPTSTALGSSLNPSDFGEPVTLTATVSASGGAGTPTGEAAFYDGQTLLGLVLLTNGTATFSTSSLGVGPHTLTARYLASPDYAASVSGVLIQTVNPATTATTLTTTPNPSQPGQSVTLTARVTASGGSPSGQVEFLDATIQPSVSLGTAAVEGGTAAFSTSALPNGRRQLIARYLGSGNYAPSTSPVVTQIVAPRLRQATETDLVSSKNPAQPDDAVTFTATVTASSGAAPTGFVTFSDGAGVLGRQALRDGQATLTTDQLVLGTSQIRAAYSGNTTYAPSSATISQEIQSEPP